MTPSPAAAGTHLRPASAARPRNWPPSGGHFPPLLPTDLQEETGERETESSSRKNLRPRETLRTEPLLDNPREKGPAPLTKQSGVAWFQNSYGTRVKTADLYEQLNYKRCMTMTWTPNSSPFWDRIKPHGPESRDGGPGRRAELWGADSKSFLLLGLFSNNPDAEPAQHPELSTVNVSPIPQNREVNVRTRRALVPDISHVCATEPSLQRRRQAQGDGRGRGRGRRLWSSTVGPPPRATPLLGLPFGTGGWNLPADSAHGAGKEPTPGTGRSEPGREPGRTSVRNEQLAGQRQGRDGVLAHQGRQAACGQSGQRYRTPRPASPRRSADPEPGRCGW